MKQSRNLVVIFPDQLNLDSTALSDFDPALDRILMPEKTAFRPGIHPKKAALMVAAFRRFRGTLEARGYTVDYDAEDTVAASPAAPDSAADLETSSGSSFETRLTDSLRRYRPERVIATLPGDYALTSALEDAARTLQTDLEIRPDDSFYATPEEFRAHAEGRKRMVSEYFYRELRRRNEVLMEDGDTPAGGSWNFDKANRESFSKKSGPPSIPPLPRFPEGPHRSSSIDTTDQPITPEEAITLLDHFVRHLLPSFGRFQDAMWDSESNLFHSRLSFALNTHLLSPRTAVSAAERAYREGNAPLSAVEGFIRQVLGWREYIRGVYWHYMPGYQSLNALSADAPLPDFFWTGETEMRCVSRVISAIRAHAYAHHIQRLMVVGLYALLAGVDPYAFHRWHLAMYVDAFDWVSLPNALGMSLYADGGLVGTKPYCAGGGYINRMSNYCGGCRYTPTAATGDDACPFTVLYWDFLRRHEERLSENQRIQLQLKNLRRKPAPELRAIQRQADALRSAS